VADRRNYTNGLNAVTRIAREEGLLTLWRGTGPTVARAMALNCTQLASYSQVKQWLLASPYFEDGLPCHFTSSLVSGFLSTVVSLPIDMAKTRLQNMNALPCGTMPYTGLVDVWSKTAAQEGFFSLWKGFTPYFFRLAPHTILYVFLAFAVPVVAEIDVAAC
jgi:solute carrier family 25 (mitochondrial oxoglutarate transporter), member 11